MLRFSQALAGIPVIARTGGDPLVNLVEFDSRTVRPGTLFVAMQGGATDGNRFIPAAIAAGAQALITDSAAAFHDAAAKGIAVAQVAHGRHALAAASANFFGHPERALALTGVTGTNGKTTTAFLLEAMLQSVARKTALIGTIENHVAGRIIAAPHTTPESRDLFQIFAEAVAAGATEAVMEVSSHALEQGRVWGLHYDAAVFTNLTRDHLDYHRTMDAYFDAKAMLFRGAVHEGGAAPPRVAVIRDDCAYGSRMAEVARAAGSEVLIYGIERGQFRAEQVDISPSRTRFLLRSPAGDADIETRLAGRVNIENTLAAATAAYARGLTLDEIVRGAAALNAVPGRFETVDAGQPFTVVVDYAHTDDALRNLILVARDFVDGTGGRVITLFGCGGDRDRTKRPLMGRAAGELSDFVVLTSDNPRSENPDAILDEIEPALKETGTGYAREVDRAAAIELAISEARPNDIVLLAGKGHEKTQTIGGVVARFDDVAVARAALGTLKPT
jgi:UDP-N-acetylmuramoyl-L-alanyl-D-glutamate--2,6-diaminopimelate ligase